MAQRLPLVGLGGEFGDAVTRGDGGAVQGEEGEGRGREGHLSGGGAGWRRRWRGRRPEAAGRSGGGPEGGAGGAEES